VDDGAKPQARPWAAEQHQGRAPTGNAHHQHLTGAVIGGAGESGPSRDSLRTKARGPTCLSPMPIAEGRCSRSRRREGQEQIDAVWWATRWGFVVGVGAYRCPKSHWIEPWGDGDAWLIDPRRKVRDVATRQWESRGSLCAAAAGQQLRHRQPQIGQCKGLAVRRTCRLGASWARSSLK